MNSYKVMVEGVFIKILGGKEGVSGFHATFYVMANNAQNAVHRVGPLVVNRMAVHGISATAGVFGTYYFVRDIWEVVSGNFSQDNEGDLGFSLFEIGGFERVYLMLRHIFLRRFKPWRLIGGVT